MASQALTDAVNALISEIDTITTDFNDAIAKLQASGNTDAEVIAALQPISDKLSALDSAVRGDSGTTTTTA